MTIRELQKAYLPSVAPEDFFILVGEAICQNKSFLFAHPEHILTQNEENRAKGYLERRLKNEPVAYITGHKEFYGREFIVTKDTLIPRPETEILVEEVIHSMDTFFPRAGSLDIVDVGTGSGNIIITLANEIKRRDTRFFGIDFSSRALNIAKVNASAHTSNASLEFLKSDLLKEYISRDYKTDYLIIAANLPYLSQEIYDATEKDVREHEPLSALLSEEKGLRHYHSLLEELRKLDRSPSRTIIFFEISPEQSSLLPLRIQELFPHSEIFIVPDLSGRKRLIKAII